MTRSTNFKSAALAVVFFALGFFVADRMTHAGASPIPEVQDGNGSAFSGTDGAIAAKSKILVIRGRRIYLIDPANGGAQRPWGELTE